jgi:hypothetical protein
MAEILLLGFHTKATRTVSDKTPGAIGSQKPLVMKRSFFKVRDGDNRDRQAEVTDEKIAY